MKRLIFIILMIPIISFAQNRFYQPDPKPKPKRNFGVGYTHRRVYIDDTYWNDRNGGDGFSTVSAPLPLNGLSFFGKLSPSTLYGLRIFGGSLSSNNGIGETEFWGAMGGMFFEARKGKIVGDWYGSIGTTIYVGKFVFSSIAESDTANLNGIFGHTDALYTEPSVGIGYDFDGTMELKFYWSYVFSNFESSEWKSSGEDIDYEVIPKGHAINFLFRFYIPIN
ncbi:MAG: hypothetical protein ACLFSQ_12470 [Candidatus Zixiibacteriota bacterium]